MIPDRMTQALGKSDTTISVYEQPDLWLKENLDQVKAVIGDASELRYTDVAGSLYPRTRAYIHLLLGTSETPTATTYLEIEDRWASANQISQLSHYRDIRNSLNDYSGNYDVDIILFQPPTIPENWETIQHLDNVSILARTIIVLKDHQGVRDFVHEGGLDVDPFLDLLQELLDVQYVGPARPFILRSLLDLCRRHNVYPQSLMLQDVVRTSFELMASGGFSHIYQGTYQNNNVAIKAMRIISTKDPRKLLKAFIREAVLWRQFKHPNILPFYGVYRWPTDHGPKMCLVSPWMEHRNMVEYLSSTPNPDRSSLMLDVARGLQYLHEFDPTVIHGDLKGNNILIDDDHRARVTDFGLCTLIEDAVHNFTPTSSTSFAGAWKYLAPELLQPEIEDPGSSNQPKKICRTTASDVYAFGCVCYEVFTGHPRFSGLGPLPTMIAITKNRNVAKPEKCADELWALITRCWEVEPYSRPDIGNIVEYLAILASSLDQSVPVLAGSAFGPGKPILLQGDQTKKLTNEDIIIALIGVAGTGKSSFVNTALCKEVALVGEDLESCTQEVRAFGCLHPDGSGRHVIIVDTPGFDDTYRFDYDVLRDIAKWLEKTYKRKVTLSGILHFHSIAESRMRGAPLKNLGMFQALCGENALGNVVLTTTNWDRVSPKQGLDREAELRSKFWQPLTEHGSRVARFQTQTYKAAWDLINLFDPLSSMQNPVPPVRPVLLVQTQLVTEGKKLHQTTAYEFLLGWWTQLTEKVKRGMGTKNNKFKWAKKQKNRLESRRSPISPINVLYISK